MIYCNAIKYGGEAEWDFLWQRYLKSNVAGERNSILHALGYSREVWLLSRYLDYSLNETAGIRNQDADSVFDSVARNEVGFFLAKAFFEQNIQRLHDRLVERQNGFRSEFQFMFSLFADWCRTHRSCRDTSSLWQVRCPPRKRVLR